MHSVKHIFLSQWTSTYMKKHIHYLYIGYGVFDHKKLNISLSASSMTRFGVYRPNVT